MSEINIFQKGFSDLVKGLNNQRNIDAVLIEIQAHAYRSIINQDLVPLNIQIHCPEYTTTDPFTFFMDKYNYYATNNITWNQLNTSQKEAISNIVPRRKKQIKKKKKNATRIKKEMLRMNKVKNFGKGNEKTVPSIISFASVIKESFIIIRKNIRKDVFEFLPDKLQLTDGSFILTSEYFIQSDYSTSIYTQNPKLHISNIDKRFVQYQISSYTFAYYHSRRRR